MKAELWREHPLLLRLLGLCPLLAVSHRLLDALLIGLVLLVTLMSTTLIVTGLRSFIAASIRLPLVLLVSAGVVALLDILIEAWMFPLHQAVGVYLPLTATSCLVLAWLEESALVLPSRQALGSALGHGLGMSWLLLLFGLVREPLGHGSLLAGIDGLPGLMGTAPLFSFDRGMLPLLAEPVGALLLMGGVLAVYAAITRRYSDTDCCAESGGERL